MRSLVVLRCTVRVLCCWPADAAASPHVAHFPCLGKPLHLVSTDAFIFLHKPAAAGHHHHAWDGLVARTNGVVHARHGPLLLCCKAQQTMRTAGTQLKSTFASHPYFSQRRLGIGNENILDVTSHRMCRKNVERSF